MKALPFFSTFLVLRVPLIFFWLIEVLDVLFFLSSCNVGLSFLHLPFFPSLKAIHSVSPVALFHFLQPLCRISKDLTACSKMFQSSRDNSFVGLRNDHKVHGRYQHNCLCLMSIADSRGGNSKIF